MIIVFIDKGLEVSNFDLLFTSLTFNQGVELDHWMRKITISSYMIL